MREIVLFPTRGTTEGQTVAVTKEASCAGRSSVKPGSNEMETLGVAARENVPCAQHDVTHAVHILGDRVQPGKLELANHRDELLGAETR